MKKLLNNFWDKVLNVIENNKIYKERKGAIIAGVCQGLSVRFGLRVDLIRIIWLIFLIPSFGTATLLYIILAIVMPTKPIVTNYRNSSYIDVNGWEKK